jgi:hypothetical protein
VADEGLVGEPAEPVEHDAADGDAYLGGELSLEVRKRVME